MIALDKRSQTTSGISNQILMLCVC